MAETMAKVMLEHNGGDNGGGHGGAQWRRQWRRLWRSTMAETMAEATVAEESGGDQRKMQHFIGIWLAFNSRADA